MRTWTPAACRSILQGATWSLFGDTDDAQMCSVNSAQATNTTLRDSNSFLQEQLAKADAELAQLHMTQQAGRGGATSGSSAAASNGGGVAAASCDADAGNGAAGLDSSRNAFNGTATSREVIEDGGRIRAAFAGEPSYAAIKQRLERNFKVKVLQPHCRIRNPAWRVPCRSRGNEAAARPD